MAEVLPLSAVVEVEPLLLADALTRFLSSRGVVVRRPGQSGALDVDLAVVDDRGVRDALSARQVAVVDPPGVDRSTREDPEPGRPFHLHRLDDVERVLDALRRPQP